MAARAKIAQFRITDEENAHLRKASTDAGFAKLSEYLRAISLHTSVIVVDNQNVVVIPSTITVADADEKLRERLRAVLRGLRGEVPQTSPGEGAGTVGASQAQAPPAPAPVGPSQGPTGSDDAAGAVPGPGKTSAPCPTCGGTEGQHQGFCEQVRGEPPVQGAAEQPSTNTPENQEAFINRRVAEQEAEGMGTAAAQQIAEAEWRQLTTEQPVGTPPALEPAPEQLLACTTCGTLKLPSAQCRDCGSRPIT